MDLWNEVTDAHIVNGCMSTRGLISPLLWNPELETNIVGLLGEFDNERIYVLAHAHHFEIFVKSKYDARSPTNSSDYSLDMALSQISIREYCF